MKVRGIKASGSFSCEKQGSFELLVHMEADPLVGSYAEFSFESILPQHEASQLADVPAFILRHHAGLFIVCAHSRQSRRSSRFLSAWDHADSILARRGMWLFSTTPEELRREPKWSRARELARCANTEVDPRDQERVIDYLSQVGQAPIRHCARLCEASIDSLDALYRLVSAGILYLDSDDAPLPAGNLSLNPPETRYQSPTIGWLSPPSVTHNKRIANAVAERM